MHRSALIPLICLVASGCERHAPTSPVPSGQERRVAHIAATTPVTTPSPAGGLTGPKEAGERMRSEAARPSPGPLSPAHPAP